MKERIMKYIIVMVMITSFTAFNAAAQAYRWIDDKGQIHYSSQPPENEKSERIKMPSLPKLNEADTDVNEKLTVKQKESADKQAKLDETARQKTAQTNEQLKKACDGMRKDLALYRSQPNVRIKVDNEARRLTPDELTKRIGDLEKSINENCENF